MQLSAICTECKEMFLFTNDFLWVRASTLDGQEGKMAILNGAPKFVCFRCSDAIGGCIAGSVEVTIKKRISSDPPDENEKVLWGKE